MTKDHKALDCHLLQTFNKIWEKICLPDITIKLNSLWTLVEKKPLKVKCVMKNIEKQLEKMQLLILEL